MSLLWMSALHDKRIVALFLFIAGFFLVFVDMDCGWAMVRDIWTNIGDQISELNKINNNYDL